MIRQSVSGFGDKIMRHFDILVDWQTRCNAKPQCGHLRLLYATSRLSVYEGYMIVPAPVSQPLWRAVAGMALFVLGFGLAGCADMSDGLTSAFADPAKYDLYECKQLEAERKALANRAAELQGLMAKAETGAAGPVVAELAYRNDYVAVRGQARLADEAWRRNKCQETPPAATTPAAASAPPPADKSKHSHPRSGSAVAIWTKAFSSEVEAGSHRENGQIGDFVGNFARSSGRHARQS